MGGAARTRRLYPQFMGTRFFRNSRTTDRCPRPGNRASRGSNQRAAACALYGLTLCSALLFAGPLRAQLSHLGEPLQLTFAGQNAEAYWSPDGKRLIFQSTRDGAECDQIYIMDADGSHVHRVSSGRGRTTCGYFLPDNHHILYASTEAEGDACPPPADRGKGYVWAVYPSYDIYAANDDGSDAHRITTTPGYDAEATVNFATGRIVYTSMASHDLELWTMAADGSGKHRLTHSLGYDGGAVYSRDAKHIVWRANHPKTAADTKQYKDLLAQGLTTPMKMELFVADSDGAHARQITHFGCASFAPTFTPDGKKILFASNKHHCDSSDFELYLINLDGTGLEQITSYGGFTSFPEFSPDGKTLVFASNLHARSHYEFNIFTASWRH